MSTRTNPTEPILHPGEILREEFLVPLEMTPYRLAKEIGVPQTRIAGILAGQRAITADTAVRLGRFFGTSAQFWLNLQAHYEAEEARRTLGGAIEQIRPWPKNEAGALVPAA